MSTSNEPNASQNEPEKQEGHTSCHHDDDPNRRKTIWSASAEAINYIYKLPRGKLRLIDRTSDLLLALAILLIGLLSFAPAVSWQIPLAVVCDIVCVVAVVAFLASRLGILRTLSDKQAVLVWDIVIGVLVLGVLIAINSLGLVRMILQASGSK